MNFPIIVEINDTFRIIIMKNKDGCNCIHLAAREGHVNVLKAVAKHVTAVELCDTDKVIIFA